MVESDVECCNTYSDMICIALLRCHGIIKAKSHGQLLEEITDTRKLHKKAFYFICQSSIQHDCPFCFDISWQFLTQIDRQVCIKNMPNYNLTIYLLDPHYENFYEHQFSLITLDGIKIQIICVY